MAKNPDKHMYDLEKTLDVLSKLFSIKSYQHGDIDESRKEALKSQFVIDIYAYLSEAKFDRREKIIRDCYKYGRTAVFKNNTNTLFPRPQ